MVRFLQRLGFVMVHLLTWVWRPDDSVPGAYSDASISCPAVKWNLSARTLNILKFSFLIIVWKSWIHLRWREPLIGSKPLVSYPSLSWCLERKIPVGRRPFSEAGRRRSSFSGDEEQSPPPYPAQGPARPRTHLHQMHKSGTVPLTIKEVWQWDGKGSALF